MSKVDVQVKLLEEKLDELTGLINENVIPALRDHEFEAVATDLVDAEPLINDALYLFADVLRAAGWTWQQVADAMGVGTKQAAQQRFGS